MAAATLIAKVSAPRIAIPFKLAEGVLLITDDGQCAAARSFTSSSGEGNAMADIGSTQTM